MSQEQARYPRFNIASFFPTTVINSQGIEERFDLDDIERKIRIRTGLDPALAQVIADQVIKKIIAEGKKEIQSTHIKELVFAEMVSRGLDKYKNLFNFDVKKFFFSEEFIEKYKGKQPQWGPIGYVVYKRTYARKKIVNGKKLQEEFWETIKRVVEGCFTILATHCYSLDIPWNDETAKMKAERMFEKMWDFKFLPPGRGLWMMGTDYVLRHGGMSLNNCGFTTTANIAHVKTKPFEFMMDSSMLGVGVGFDTKGAGTLKVMKPAKGKYKFVIPDTREGWVEALRRVLIAYFDGVQLPDLDFSAIRPKGSPIEGFGGVASGPDPLVSMCDSLVKLLDPKVGTFLSSVDIVDIMNFVGKCVVSGNVRRSAQIALGMPDDKEYVSMKDPVRFSAEMDERRHASNNSVVVDPDAGQDYSMIASSISKNGEPGIIWLKNAQKYSRMQGQPDWKDKKVAGVNPCGEQSLESSELCCLVETFPSRHETQEEFNETLKYAYLYAKSVTLMKTHWQETNAIMLKNRRIGTSMSGIIDAMMKHGRRNFLRWCDEGYTVLRKLDEEYSDWLCVPRSVKITTVKPSGTTSLLPGVSPGIHYPHAEYYIRRMRVASNSPLLKPLGEAGYKIEPDATGDKETMVVEFPVHIKDYIRGKDDVSMELQVMNAIDLQKYWSDNQVSITVTFKPEEASRIKDVLQTCEDKLKGISFLPLFEHGYKQAPYESITREKYEEIVSGLKPLDLTDCFTIPEGVRGCDGDRCEI